jgi:hypothetical protein
MMSVSGMTGHAPIRIRPRLAMSLISLCRHPFLLLCGILFAAGLPRHVAENAEFEQV